MNTAIMKIFRSKIATLHARKYHGHNRGSKRAFVEVDNTSPSSRSLKGRYEAFVFVFTTAIFQYYTGHNSAEVCMTWLKKDQYIENNNYVTAEPMRVHQNWGVARVQRGHFLTRYMSGPLLGPKLSQREAR